MYRYLPTLLLLIAGAFAWAQDSAPDDDSATPESRETADEASEEASDAQADDSNLDEESYLDAEEEDFVPTEDIPADQAIPFPTDI
jgi:hypothetical protein